MSGSWKQGDRVRLWQVKKADYEGKEGTIVGKFDRKKKRWPVTLDFNDKTVNVSSKNLRKGRPKKKMSPPELMQKAKSSKGKSKGKSKKRKLKIGDRVKLVNVSKVQYEGKLGTISGAFIQKKLRWPVKLDEKEKKVNLKPENLQLVEEEPEKTPEKQVDKDETDQKEEEGGEAEQKAEAGASMQPDEPKVKAEEAAEAKEKSESNDMKAPNQANDTPEPSEKENAEPEPAENEPAPVENKPEEKEEEVKAAEEPKKAEPENEPARAKDEPGKQNEEEEVEAADPDGGESLPEQREEKEKIDFSVYAKKLPVARTHEETQQRHELFTGMDQSNNGQLSLAEIELGILNYVGEDVYLMKPAIKMAYKAARGIAPEEDHDDDAFVEFKEFRIFLSMVRQYIELYAAFDAIDSGDDDRISIKEFKSSIEMLSDWGIDVKDPEATFSEIDTNGGGQVLFEEFCRWAMNKHLDYDKSFDEGESEAKLQEVSVDKEEGYEAYKVENDESEQRSEESIDLAKYASMLPVGRTHDETQRRHKMFNDMDVSGNGQLSLAEIDCGVQGFLAKNLDMGPAIKMAYKAARAIDKDEDSDGMDDKYVEFSEFRILLVSIRQYMQLQAAFDSIDEEGDGRINYEEFSTSLEMLEEWGVKVEDPKAAFDAIDSNDGGQVLFGEFCKWALKQGLDYDEDLKVGDAKAKAMAVEVEKDEDEEPEIYKAPVKKYEKVELDDLAKKLPVGRNDEEAAERKKMFDGFDASGNDQLSLAEIDLGILNVLGEEFHLMKPAIGMAYKASRGVDPRGNMADSFVEFSEFRILLCNIRRYIELFAAFEAVDDGDDERIDLKEFESSLGMLKEWGINVEDPEKTFGEIDENGGGQILFNEFAHWALKTGLDYDSDVDEGDAQAEKQEVDIPEDPPEENYEEEVEAADEIKVKIDFEAMVEKLPIGNTKEDKKKRKEMFKSIDQSNSGELSLAEIELGVLDYMGEDAGQLKDAIRMAYKVAKQGRGGKDDDYVERKEMKTLLICLKRYFELWAAFEAVDTGDDKRINFEEFSKAVDVLKKWGVEIEDPQAEFDSMDSNDGGQALFGEFCAWAMKKNLDVDDEEDTSE